MITRCGYPLVSCGQIPKLKWRLLKNNRTVYMYIELYVYIYIYVDIHYYMVDFPAHV